MRFNLLMLSLAIAACAGGLEDSEYTDATSDAAEKGYPGVTRLMLVNASTEQVIRELGNNANIDLAQDGSALNIRADVDGPTGPVAFHYDGWLWTTARNWPYTIAGGSSRDYWAMTPAPSLGSHTVTARPTHGTPLTVSFKVSNGGGPRGGPGPGDATSTGVSYRSTDAAFLNPERGFYHSKSSTDNFSGVRSDGITLIRMPIGLESFRNRPISPEKLDEIRRALNAVRNAGIKVIPRFVYNFDSQGQDAPNDRVLGHITQLKPVLQQHGDVIAMSEAGFVGKWGEWHGSSNNLTTRDRLKAILDGLHAALPNNGMVMLRYVSHLKQMYPYPLTAAKAFSGTNNQARTGHHNDCFLANAHDSGTYTGQAGGQADSIAGFKGYLEQMSAFVPVGGETCGVTASEHRTDCGTTKSELARFHFTTLNTQYYGPDIARWKNEGCYNEIARRLGYRFSLTDGSFARAVKPGGRFRLVLNVRNTGYGALYNPRAVYVVLEGPGGRQQVQLATDPRRWAPGATSQVSVRLELPASLGQGDYALALWLPDQASGLAYRSEYSVRFANDDVWDSGKGYNRLGSLKVTATARGAANPNAGSMKIIP